jgi:protein phosphatase
MFLGDYADRGKSGVEVIEAVDALIKKHPENVFPLKGNHEDYSEAGAPKFSPCHLVSEAKQKIGHWQSYFENKLKPFIKSLYLGVIVRDEALFVHGGISSKIECLNNLEHPTADVETDILWSDPFEGNGEYPNHNRGVGVMFGKDITVKVCERLGVNKIIRSHEPQKVTWAGGPCFSHDQMVITTSTTSVYGGQPFILSIDPRDFSFKCYRLGKDSLIKSKIVDCSQ